MDDFVKYLAHREETLENELTQVKTLLKQYKTTNTKPKVSKSSTKVKEEEPIEPCMICANDPEGYDLACGHPICHKCFKGIVEENDGQIQCKICKKKFTFEYELQSD